MQRRTQPPPTSLLRATRQEAEICGDATVGPDEIFRPYVYPKEEHDRTRST